MPGSGFVFAAFEYPCMTIKKIKQYTSVHFTIYLPKPLCLDGTVIDSGTILVTMYYCGYVGVWLVAVRGD